MADRPRKEFVTMTRFPAETTEGNVFIVGKEFDGRITILTDENGRRYSAQSDSHLLKPLDAEPDLGRNQTSYEDQPIEGGEDDTPPTVSEDDSPADDTVEEPAIDTEAFETAEIIAEGWFEQQDANDKADGGEIPEAPDDAEADHNHGS